MDLPQNLFFHLTSEMKYQISYIEQDSQIETGHFITVTVKLVLTEIIVRVLEMSKKGKAQLGSQGRL